MNEVKEALKEEIVKPELKKQLHDTKGEVVKTYYEDDLYYADVEITHQITGNTKVLKQVPITYELQGGVSGTYPKKGDNVWLAFDGGKGNYPRILRRYVANYEDEKERMKADKGAYKPTSYGYF